MNFTFEFHQVTAQLQEATQSHNVKNKKLSFDAASSSVAAGKTKSSSSAGPASSSHLNKTALILFEDIDVVFEEDEGFYAAVNSLAASTKRPVILTTSNGLFSPRKFLKSDPQVSAKQIRKEIFRLLIVERHGPIQVVTGYQMYSAVTFMCDVMSSKNYGRF